MSEHPISEMSFEQAMSELDAVVSRLERNDVALEDSISLYERGEALKAHCEKKLKEAEMKVAKINEGANGEAAGIEPFNDK